MERELREGDGAGGKSLRRTRVGSRDRKKRVRDGLHQRGGDVQQKEKPQVQTRALNAASRGEGLLVEA